MPLYNWTCHVCTKENLAPIEICVECSFPASAEGRQILKARQQRGGRSLVATYQGSEVGRARLDRVPRQRRVEEISICRTSDFGNVINFVLASEVRIAALALLAAAILVVSNSWGKYTNAEFVDGIRVEAHGMLLDLLVIGIFILWLNLKRSEAERVRRYEEEIDDLREWKSDDASYRIAARIRRLNGAGKVVIFLSRCYLRKANLREIILVNSAMQQVDLGESNLRNAKLSNVDLDTAFMGYSDMRGAEIVRSNLTRSRLVHSKADGAIFRGSVFRKASLHGARFRGANFQDCDFDRCIFDGADLSGADFRNARGLSAIALSRAFSLSYARFDEQLLDSLKVHCPQLLAMRRGSKFAPSAPRSSA